jgi:shikimate kinase
VAVSIRRNIILTGFMGTGKSAVGRKLAARLGRKFFDTDWLIEQQAKEPISVIFAEQGESYFRTLEKRVINQICNEKNVVIATGGGAMIDEENVARLQESGTLICLTATPEIILERVGNNSDRPLLQGSDSLVKIRSLLSDRAEVYAKANVTIDTSNCDIEKVVEAIIMTLEREEHS